MKQVLKISVFATVLTILSVFNSSAMAGEVYYRWTDERGDPVHSDRPPPKDVDYEVISTNSRFKRPVASGEGAVPLTVEPSASNQFAQETKGAVKVQKNPEYCQRAKENLEMLSSSAKIQMRNDQGEMRYIGNEERDIQRKNAEDTIVIHCE